MNVIHFGNLFECNSFFAIESESIPSSAQVGDYFSRFKCVLLCGNVLKRIPQSFAKKRRYRWFASDLFAHVNCLCVNCWATSSAHFIGKWRCNLSVFHYSKSITIEIRMIHNEQTTCSVWFNTFNATQRTPTKHTCKNQFKLHCEVNRHTLYCLRYVDAHMNASKFKRSVIFATD